MALNETLFDHKRVVQVTTNVYIYLSMIIPKSSITFVQIFYVRLLGSFNIFSIQKLILPVSISQI